MAQIDLSLWMPTVIVAFLKKKKYPPHKRQGSQQKRQKVRENKLLDRKDLGNEGHEVTVNHFVKVCKTLLKHINTNFLKGKYDWNN